MIFILQLLALIVILVVIHELGHFVTAKLFGIKVNEFGVGFPPKLWGVKKGETEYTINAVPLGGFVKLEGENDPSHPRSLAAKPPWQRAIVLASGSFMNAVLAIAIFAGLYMVPRDVQIGDVFVDQVTPNSPAAAAGLMAGDQVLFADGKDIESVSHLGAIISRNLGEDMDVTVQRGGQTLETTVSPRWDPPEGEGPTGVVLRLENATIVERSDPFWEAIPKGFKEVGTVLSVTWNALTSWVGGDAPVPFSGPVGIVRGTQEVVDEGGALVLIPLAALLSVSLAIFNILPIPALDGGRLLFVIIEFVRGGKRIPPEKEGLVHMIGFALLIAMVLVISYNDITKIIRGESFIR
ncbi:MAG: PDZ domain-containing protein [SAR202 cluster bacterium]|nr:PDZ domain-containing protein [SAR202 cluster bacterium]